MDAISLDLRLRILRACDAGDETREQTADTFGVSRSFVQKLLRLDERGDPIAPRPRAGGPEAALDGAAVGELRRLVRARPDATLAELAAGLRAVDGGGGPAVSVPTVWRAVRGLGLPVKKSRSTPASGTPAGSGPCGAGGGGGPGTRTRPRSCSSTRAGPTRPWPGCAAGPRPASGWSGPSPVATGGS